MSNYENIQNLLDTQLQTVNNLPTLTLEGVRRLDTNSSWCRSTLLPVEPITQTIGKTGLTEWRGLYQIDLFTPEGYGVSSINNTVDNILNAFTKGTYLGTNSELLIWKSWRNPNISVQSKFIQTPIMVQWSEWS